MQEEVGSLAGLSLSSTSGSVPKSSSLKLLLMVLSCFWLLVFFPPGRTGMSGSSGPRLY